MQLMSRLPNALAFPVALPLVVAAHGSELSDPAVTRSSFVQRAASKT
jgi:hypothetical protein